MLNLDALQSMKVMVATPCYGFACTPIYTASMLRMMAECAKVGLNPDLQIVSDAHIDRARAKLVAQFLAGQYTHLFWIDADIQFTPEAFVRILLADRDVAAGVYPLKHYNWPERMPGQITREEFEALYTDYPFNAVNGRVASDADGFAEVAEAPNGFLCIKRHVLQRMMAAHPELRWLPDHLPPAAWDAIPYTYWMFFSAMIDPVSHRFLSEDYAFCHRWRGIGGKVFVDLHSKLNHMGPHIWRGNLLASLRTAGGLDHTRGAA